MIEKQNKLETFTQLPWKEKVDYMKGFFNTMIKKSQTDDDKTRFQKKLQEITNLKQDEEANKNLEDMYKSIIRAEEKGKQEKREQMKKTVLQSKNIGVNQQMKEQENAEAYLEEHLNDFYSIT